MTAKKPYRLLFKSYTLQRWLSDFFQARISLFLILFFILPASLFAEGLDPGDEELSVNLHVKGIGSVEVPAIYRNEQIYLSVTDVFDFLKINNRMSESVETVEGFIIHENASYKIDFTSHTITYQQEIQLLDKGDLVRTEDKLFLKSNYFGSQFGLHCQFNFRNLAVTLETDIELPVIKEMRQELMRANIGSLKGESKADSIIGRSFPTARFGMIDWSVANVHSRNTVNDTRMSLGIGSMLLGGELNMSLNYHNRTRLSEKQQYYLWRYVNNNHRGLRQVMAGKIQPGFISSVYAPSVGVQLTNSSTTFKKSFGTYTLSNTTNPGWIVELYVNNVLVNYVKADASGFYTFQVPLVYGSSVIKLRFYGPYGEEKATEQFVHIPFNFVPAKQFEYNVSAGLIEDGIHSYYINTTVGDSTIRRKVDGKASTLFTHSRFNYGLNRYITIGGGAEYLSSVHNGMAMPFVNTSIRLTPSLMFTSEYVDKVVSKSILTYRLLSGIQVELNYSRYDKNQEAIQYSFLEQRKVVVTLPFRSKSFSGFSRMAINEIILPTTKYTVAEWLLSGSVKGVSANVSSYAVFMNEGSASWYSNLSAGFRLPGYIVITPQVQYEFSKGELISAKCSIEKRIKAKALANAYYERNIQSDITFIGVGLRFDLSFTRAGFSVVRSNLATTFTEHASGSFIVDKNFKPDHRTVVGRGGLVIVPFLDLNNNSIKDPGEPKAEGLRLSMNGGRIVNNVNDTTTTIYDLEPFVSYDLKLQPGSFEHISWFIRNKIIKVEIDPNYLKRIDIPVTVAAEVAGTVYLNQRSQNGQGKITVCIDDLNGNRVAKTLTESDGYFSILSLAPGKYKVNIDPAQLEKLNLRSIPSSHEIEIKTSVEGDVKDGLDFILQSLSEEKPVQIAGEED